MLYNVKKLRKQKLEQGFTIIEVVIVLAIAGLIILVVLLAVPALQRNGRNTAIKSDASAIAAGVTEFASNNEGKAITNITQNAADATKIDLAGASGTSPSVAKVQGGTVVPAAQTTATAITVVAGQINTVIGYSCTGATISGASFTPVTVSKRAIAIVYASELASGIKVNCLDG